MLSSSALFISTSPASRRLALDASFRPSWRDAARGTRVHTFRTNHCDVTSRRRSLITTTDITVSQPALTSRATLKEYHRQSKMSTFEERYETRCMPCCLVRMPQHVIQSCDVNLSPFDCGVDNPHPHLNRPHSFHQKECI